MISSTANGAVFEAKTTFYVIVCGLLAATGGVTAMDDFLEKFFPAVYVRKHHVKENNYCKYNDKGLQLFTSSLYLAAIVASFFASKCCTKFGRRPTMGVASMFFLAGVVFNAAAQNLSMLIIGRLLLGLGVGFANQIRGMLNILFQLMITIGILVAQILNYFMSSHHPWGWRLSLGGAGVPALILCFGSLLIPETPTSLIERGHLQKGKLVLQKIRGTDAVEEELGELVAASEAAEGMESPFKGLKRRESFPPLVVTVLIQVFQQFGGMNAIMFYAPVLFQTMGFKSDASLLSNVITGSVNCVATFVSSVLVDRAGRRVLLLEASVQMFLCQVIMGSIMAVHLKDHNTLPEGMAMGVVVLICAFVAGFAWSWGPMGWLIPSEIFPIQTRNAGYFFGVSTNMICTFIIAQTYLSMLCSMRAGVFFFFASWIAVMGLFVAFLLPETKGVPIEEVKERVWKKHWFWKRYMTQDDEHPDKEVQL
ncbi:Sugar transport protein 6 [Acorus calamus]|uniref:Sugar transport protein 6 n=1 Tax=Acorus calamus TaxID=4465 RepID=A0AAV9DGQ4_ACOCL|nr:Sugar transport protein 6 [Acorus calamus]